MDDSSPIDPAVFTTDFVSSTKTLIIDSTDVSKADIYNFEVVVYYQNHPTIQIIETFQIELEECLSSSLDVDASIWVDDQYYIYQSTKALTWTPSATGISGCGNVLWSLSMTDLSTIDAAVFTYDFTSSSTKTLDIYSTDVAKAGLYDFLVTVYYDVQTAVQVTAQFRITLEECLSSSLNVDPSIWQDDYYYFYTGVKALTWSPVSSGIAECGNVLWSLDMDDGSPIDPAFSHDFSTSTKTLDINSVLPGKAGFYDFKVTVYYDIQPAVQVTQVFQIELRECLASTLDVDASIWLNYHYYIYEPSKFFIWTPAATGISECGIVLWQLTMLDTSPIDTAVFYYDFSTATKRIDIYSTDISKAGIYVFEVTVYYDI